jgi:hypothetical protein
MGRGRKRKREGLEHLSLGKKGSYIIPRFVLN